MRRSLLLPILFLAVVPAFAEKVTVHLDLSESVRAALGRGDIEGVYVSVAGHAVLTKDTTTIVDGVAPGKATVRAILNTGKGNYVVNPKDLSVDVKPGAEVTVPIHSLLVIGTISLHGKSLHGSITFWHSESPREDPVVGVPSDDEGRFIAPLPHAGPYDLMVEWRNRGQIAIVPHVELRDTGAHIDLPDGVVAGRVVDADGNGVAGAKVLAKLNASTPRTVGGLAVTDMDGNFAIEGLLGGTWTLCAAEWTPMDVVIRDGERKEGVLLRVGH
jgi:hypothetical protein